MKYLVTPEQRFMSKVKQSEKGCWEWLQYNS